MAIRRSASVEVEELIAALLASAEDDSRREASLARLAVIGPRAVSHVLRALVAATAPAHRARLLAALERIPSPRSVGPLLRAIESREDPARDPVLVRVAAVRAARPLLDLAEVPVVLLECLTRIVLDPAEAPAVRQAGFDALSGLSVRALEPIRARLAADPDPAMRARASAEPAPRAADEIEPGLSSSRDPDAVLTLVGRIGATAPLSSLHALLKAVREREESGDRRKAEWTTVRGAIHVALARRGSRVALYDLREALEGLAKGPPLPTDYMTAMALVGDATCLEPLGHAWMQTAAERGRDTPWRQQLRDTFRQVWLREKPVSRRRALERLQHRWSSASDARRLQDLAGAVSRPRRERAQ